MERKCAKLQDQGCSLSLEFESKKEKRIVKRTRRKGQFCVRFCTENQCDWAVLVACYTSFTNWLFHTVVTHRSVWDEEAKKGLSPEVQILALYWCRKVLQLYCLLDWMMIVAGIIWLVTWNKAMLPLFMCLASSRRGNFSLVFGFTTKMAKNLFTHCRTYI